MVGKEKMREYKFKAWDKKQKKWFGVNLHMSVADGLLWWQYGYGCEILSAEERENIELLEYTTLQDENVVEIYRGDILRFDNYPEALDAEVVWFEGAFRVKGLSHEADIEEYLSEVNEVSKVIGNIFENLELMGESNIRNYKKRNIRKDIITKK